MIFHLSLNKFVCYRSVFCLALVDEFRNGKEKISSAPSVGVANKQLLSSSLDWQSSLYFVHFPRGHQCLFLVAEMSGSLRNQGYAASGKRVFMLNRGGCHATLTPRCQRVRVETRQCSRMCGYMYTPDPTMHLLECVFFGAEAHLKVFVVKIFEKVVKYVDKS